MRIDLGSGRNKFHECIGIDKIDYPETDIVHDFNQRLPLEDNSVDFVMASHSLQYVNDLQAVMEDIYRVCRHKAVVCIVAPYAHVASHIVNPEYKQLFNEYSPLYWTKHAETILTTLGSNEFLFSPQKTWSVQDADSRINIDFRALCMDFFYFSSFREGYEDFELALLRQSQLNVASQIMYQLLVVKEPINDDDILMLKNTIWFEEPDYVKAQRSVSSSQEEEEQPCQLDQVSSILKKENEDIEVSGKMQIRKRSTRKRTIAKRRMKAVHKKRSKYAKPSR